MELLLSSMSERAICEGRLIILPVVPNKSRGINMCRSSLPFGMDLEAIPTISQLFDAVLNS